MKEKLFPNGGNIRLFRGDCFEELAKLPESSVDLILTDPPYGTMAGFATRTKGYGGKGWREKVVDWDKESLDIDQTKTAMARVLKPKCRALLFAQEPYTSALVQSAPFTTDPVFKLDYNYRFVWVKNNTGNALLSATAPTNLFEDIVCFERAYAGLSDPLREYAQRLRVWIGKSNKEVAAELGNLRGKHFLFCAATSQFSLCTPTTYQDLIDHFQIDSWEGFLPYEELDKLAPKNKFRCPNGERQVCNVLEYPKDKEHLHPTQKPVALLKRLIEVFTDPNDIVVDFTMGSGSTGVAAVLAGRRFVGIERDPDYYEIAKDRLSKNLFAKIE